MNKDGKRKTTSVTSTIRHATLLLKNKEGYVRFNEIYFVIIFC